MSIPTPLETNGNARQTTLAEEDTFLAALVADSPRVSRTVVGQTVGGLNIDMLGVGYPSAPAFATGTPCLMILGLQHGVEIIGREVALTLARDLAYATDPALIAYLAQHPVFIVPSVNRDRVGTESRENLNNVDLNRDHVKLTQPEARAVDQAVKMVHPHVGIDLHENNEMTPTLEAGIPANWMGDDRIKALSHRMIDAVLSGLAAQSIASGQYQYTTRGPGNMSSHFGHRRAVCTVFETNRSLPTMTERLSAQLAGLRIVIDWHAANHATIAAERVGAVERLTKIGNAGRYPFWLDTDTVLEPAPIAYTLTQAQYDATAVHRDLLEITAVQDGALWRVPMGQVAQPMIPYLFDPQSPEKVVDGTRVMAPPYVPASGNKALTYGPIVVGGKARTVESVQVQANGQLSDVYTRP